MEIKIQSRDHWTKQPIERELPSFAAIFHTIGPQNPYVTLINTLLGQLYDCGD